ncbi:hypothetical protein KP509_03G044700 [Ceratopteris richardii]|uniref:Pentatricopeptide repeat-containing protein n=1 Tax=Ceratopteris richardii TaxID=49495 RepID=A0A8T2VB36_CERRI|nr:hypothetical protein KP509_03G044700 [Ceratopteris richardii]KAH7441590.1 hypothetical protein KP509_03G044700 [Ceratopteris richardii]
MKIELQKLSSVAGAAEGIPCISHPIRCGVQTFGERSTKCAGYITMPFMEHASILENVASRPVEYVDTQTEGVHISSFDHLNIHSWNLAIKTYARQGSRLQALHLFQQLQQNGIIPDKHSFVYTLVACGEPGALGDGKRLHAHLCASQFRSDFVILTALVNMYGKHSRLKDASNCFDQITRRDVVAWATVIQLFSQQGYDIEAHQFCSQMLQEGILPDKVALMCILDAYTHMSNKQCTHIHVSALLNIEEEDVQISTALLSMLGKTNKLLNAIQLFDSMLTRNVLTWSAMISLLERAEQNERARQIFNDMLEQGTLPNEITFLNILSAYKNEKDLIAGHRLHARLAGSTCEMGLPLSNSLLNFYIKCSSLQDAVLLFQNLSKRDVISFTAMISLSVDDGDADNAFGFLNRMLSLGHTPDQVAFTSLLDACNILSDLDARNILHDFIVECSYDSEHILTNSLLNVYCKHGSLMEAHWIFMKMSVRDIISWNGIIGMHSQLGNMHDALQLLSRMEQEIIPDKVTFLNIMICFTNFSALPHGKYIHTQLRAMNLVSELAVNTSLVSMYGRCGSLTLAQMIYSEVQEMDLVFWRELVTVNAINCQFCYIKSLFRRLLLECFIPDELCYIRIFSALCGQVVLLEVKKYHVLIMNTSFALDISMNNALLHMYGKCGCLKAAQEFFRRMVNKDSITWNTLLTICNLHSQGLQIIFILDKMCWEGYLPDVVTWTNRIIACVSSIDLSEGKRVHACLHYCKLDSECFVASALINMYGKCGDLDASRKMFDFLPCKNLVTWNSMIAVYALHGLGEEAIKLFNLMLSMRLLPDKATFASILAGCSHVGLHVEGCHILAFMKNHGISPSEDDFSCIIDLLGRLGRLDEAESLINDQVDSTTVKSLRALLSACTHQRDVERGERAAEKVFHIDSNDTAAYVLLSNLYAHDYSSILRVAA